MLFAPAVAVVALVLFFVYNDGEHRKRQTQVDTRIARVWVAGVSLGAAHHLRLGTSLQRKLNEHGIHLLGDYQDIVSAFGGDPSGVEIWFGYESFLTLHPDLECHRVKAEGAAFTDDLGQPYHGYLDIHGRTVGVYLPGYDHAARKLTCTLCWMPRKPANAYPISRPMTFVIALPPAKRVLPLAESLPKRVVVSRDGVTVTADQASLSAPKLAQFQNGQRDLTFRIKVEGGSLLDEAALDIDQTAAQTFRDPSNRTWIIRGGSIRATGRTFLGGRSALPMLAGMGAKMEITDPYGIPLLVPYGVATPLHAKELIKDAREGRGIVWVASVNSAGRGTDVVKIHLDVLRRNASPAPFDLLLPVDVSASPPAPSL